MDAKFESCRLCVLSSNKVSIRSEAR